VKFWNQLRRTGSWIVGAIALVTLVLSALRTPDADEPSAASVRPAAASPRSSGTSGL
jgi:hypothetical protein